VGVWRTVVGTLNQVVHLWAHASTGAYTETLARLESDAPWRAFVAASRDWVAESRTELLVPTAMSPMA
jgi:hypothetical protein